jgi:[pyruvate, water dikinase]-phosphate phosphotransferase / [pyruvate, water dikinase] kinase
MHRLIDGQGVNRFHLHLVSDSTGDTVHAVAKACLVQFDGAEPIEHSWMMVRSETQLDRALAGIGAHPGLVLYTMVDDELRHGLEEGCRRHQIPAIPVLDPVMTAIGSFLGAASRGVPGQQHLLDAEYFQRVDAMTFALGHDDGQSAWGLDDADVILVGVSRTSKTPTCLYLGNRGLKAANVPFVPGTPLPKELLSATKPLIVGLTNDPERLVQLRRSRLTMLQAGDGNSDYADIEQVKAEVQQARRFFTDRQWPVIDITRRSIEETAATIMQLLARRRGEDA